jgi:hypothetical protein
MPARGQSIGETIDEENHQGSNPVRSPHTVHSPRRAAASFNQALQLTAAVLGRRDVCEDFDINIAGYIPLGRL